MSAAKKAAGAAKKAAGAAKKAAAAAKKAAAVAAEAATPVVEGAKGLLPLLSKAGKGAAGFAGSAMPYGILALSAMGALSTIDDLWDEGELIGGPEWTKAGQRKKALNFALRGMADDDLSWNEGDIMEQSLSRRLSDLAEVRSSPIQPASYVNAKDQKFMADMAQRYRAELQRASLNNGPSIAEIAARTGLV